MHVELRIPVTDASGRVFLTWAPVAALARVVNPTGRGPVPVVLRSAGRVGGLRFASKRTHLGTPTLALKLPASGKPVRFYVAGEFGRPSVNLGDALIEVRRGGGLGRGLLLAKKRVTVRVRKNAQTLSAGERNRFLAALGTLNGAGAGRFRDFREMHVSVASPEEHGNVGFLPWHRAYLLDLERELQAIDPCVTLPYWRFDQPAPNVFDRRFMGVSNAVGRVEFIAGHPLNTWRTDGALGISRTPFFTTTAAPPGLLTEVQTIALGGPPGTAAYASFDAMEGNPHGSAHTRFGGYVSSVPTAPRDPLFFMLHANVDRLWAKWQWARRRSRPDNPLAFAPAVPDRIGHRLGDTMWPWNGVTAAPRPPTAPGGAFASSPATTAPGPTPTVLAMIDYLAVGGGRPLGFAYDDVPFELEL